MERLTDKRMKGEGFIAVDPKEYKKALKNEKPNVKQIYKRLLEIENILGDEYDLGRLRELVEADRDGRCVVLPCGEGDRLSRGGLEYIADHWNITLTAFAKDAATKAGERLGIFSVEESEQAFKEREGNG